MIPLSTPVAMPIVIPCSSAIQCISNAPDPLVQRLARQDALEDARSHAIGQRFHVLVAD